MATAARTSSGSSATIRGDAQMVEFNCPIGVV
jgi:hypothetical protein